jgi:hypothetical protein
LPEVLQESVLDIATNSVIDVLFVLVAAFGTFAPWVALSTLVALLLICLFVAFDGYSYLLGVWQRFRSFVHSKRVKPIEYLYEEDLDRSADAEATPAAADAVTVFKQEAEEQPSAKSAPSKSVRIGLFGKQDKIRLKEGQWRTIRRRVTQVRAFRSLHEMNRKFHVVAPVDAEVLEYQLSKEGEADADSDDDEEDEEDEEDGEKEGQEHSNKAGSINSDPSEERKQHDGSDDGSTDYDVENQNRARIAGAVALMVQKNKPLPDTPAGGVLKYLNVQNKFKTSYELENEYEDMY